MKEEDKSEFLYQEFLRIIKFNPDRDIVKIEGDWVHVYRWTASNNLGLLRNALEAEEERDSE